MNRFGKLKLAFVAGAALASLAGSPAAGKLAAPAAQIEAFASLPESVQERYRPVLGQVIPDIPTDWSDPSAVFWKDNIRRCKRGWNAPELDGTFRFITGYQYFYGNFMKIPVQDKERNEADWKNPWFRDNDEVIFNQLWRNTARVLANGTTVSARNHVEAKCRSIGWTQITLLGVAMHTFIFRPDRAIGMGYSDNEVVNIERLWFQESWARLHPMFRSWQGREMVVVYNNEEKFSVGWVDEGKKKIVNEHNSVLFKIVTTKAGVFKGLRLNLIIAIEAGKWAGDSLKNFYNENLDCLEMGDYKWGMFLIGGTSNVIINKSTNYREIYFNHQAFNATRHFTAKTMVLTGYIDLKTGKSDANRALAYILGQRKLREGDPQVYQQYLIENPLNEQECFIPNESFAYDTAKVRGQLAFVRAHGFDEMWLVGRLDYERDVNNLKTGRVKFVQDPTGKWEINREGLPNPLYKNLHIAALDDTYKGLAAGQKLRKQDSQNAFIIYRQPTAMNIKSDMPVATFLHKTEDMDEIYEECYKGLLFYDVMQCLYEYNHDGFVKFLREKKELRRLFYIGSSPGLKVTPKVKTELTYLGTRYFSDGRYQNITNVKILEALAIWGSKANTDIGSAFHLILDLLDLTQHNQITERDDRPSASKPLANLVKLGGSPAVLAAMQSGNDYGGIGRSGLLDPNKPTGSGRIIKLGGRENGRNQDNRFRTQYAA